MRRNLVAALQEFFAMDGHGLYVWLSYGLSWLVLLGLVWRVRSARRQFIRLAQARSQRRSSDATAHKEP